MAKQPDRQAVNEGWQAKETARVAGLSNRQLLDETLEAVTGDDWEGSFTPKGRVTCDLLRHELYLRLYTWLDQPRPK